MRASSCAWTQPPSFLTLKYIFTGLQIIKPEVFKDFNDKVFSINKVWDRLIEQNELNGFVSENDFFHVSTLDIYKNLSEKFKD